MLLSNRIPSPQSLIPRLAESLIPRRAHSLITGMGNAVLSVVLAPACAACGAVLDEPLRGCVCRNCWSAIRCFATPVCDACGDPLRRPIEQQIAGPGSRECCSRCSGSRRLIDRARAVGEYDGALREIIHALKYEKRRSLASGIAALMRESGRPLLDSVEWVVPVPLHYRRERARGFNQARELARHLGLSMAEPLARVRHTVSQIELPADRRHANVLGAFHIKRQICRRRLNLTGTRILLVDDVSTTGATLEACAQVLKEAGAAEVFALTAARVVIRRHQPYQIPDRKSRSASGPSSLKQYWIPERGARMARRDDREY
jgi:ComF family protein